MRIDHKNYISALMFLRAHFKKYDIPIPGTKFKDKFGFLVGQLETVGIIKVLPNCYNVPDFKFVSLNGKPAIGQAFTRNECGILLTMKGYWTIYKRIGID